MHREPPDAVTAGRGDAAAGRVRGRRRFRLVPPAVTPLRAADIAAGLVGQRRGRGRDRFRRTVESALDAEGSATYTSFRRALGACLLELRRHADERGTAGEAPVVATGDGTGEAPTGDGRTDQRRTVAIPAFCSSDFADAIEGVGLAVVRYDVDPATLAADPASVETALDADPLALIAVNVLGYTSAMADLASRCDAADAALVEALGYALGSAYDGRALGTFGDCAVVNFQQGKPIPVGGGMVLGRDPPLSFEDEGRPPVAPNVGALAGYAAFSRPRPYYAYTRLRDLLATVGVSAPDTTHPEHKFDVAYEEPFGTLSDFQGTVGHRVYARLDDHRERRRQTATHYADELADISGVQHVRPVDGLTEHQHVRYPIRLATTALRARVQASLADVGVQATTLYDWPVLDPAEFPGAARLQREILTLPTHPYVDERDRRRVVEVVRAAATGHAGTR